MSAEKSKTPPDKRRKYDDAFKAEALRLASESRSTQAAAQQLGISPELLYRCQQAQLIAEVGSMEVARDPDVCQLRAELHAKGYPVGRWRIRRALAAAGLCAQQPRSFVPRPTDSDPNVRAAPNLLLGQPAPSAPNQV